MSVNNLAYAFTLEKVGKKRIFPADVERRKVYHTIYFVAVFAHFFGGGKREF